MVTVESHGNSGVREIFQSLEPEYEQGSVRHFGLLHRGFPTGGSVGQLFATFEFLFMVTAIQQSYFLMCICRVRQPVLGLQAHRAKQ